MIPQPNPSPKTSQPDPVALFNEALTELQNQRTQQLGITARYQDIEHQAVANEHARLSQKYGPDHPRIQALTTRLAVGQATLNATKQEAARSATRQEPLPNGGWRVKGRVFGDDEKPMPNLTVYLSDEKREQDTDPPFTCTNEAGYYAITLNADQVHTYQHHPLLLTVSDADRAVLYRGHSPLQAVADAVDLYDVHLGDKQKPCTIK